MAEIRDRASVRPGSSSALVDSSLASVVGPVPDDVRARLWWEGRRRRKLVIALAASVTCNVALIVGFATFAAVRGSATSPASDETVGGSDGASGREGPGAAAGVADRPAQADTLDREDAQRLIRELSPSVFEGSSGSDFAAKLLLRSGYCDIDALLTGLLSEGILTRRPRTSVTAGQRLHVDVCDLPAASRPDHRPHFFVGRGEPLETYCRQVAATQASSDRYQVMVTVPFLAGASVVALRPGDQSDETVARIHVPLLPLASYVKRAASQQTCTTQEGWEDVPEQYEFDVVFVRWDDGWLPDRIRSAGGAHGLEWEKALPRHGQ